MDKELMRQGFEAWWSRQAGFRDSSKARVAFEWISSRQEYRNPGVQCCWEAWQASRDALVVKLPGVTGHEYDPLADADYQARCKEAIEAQGLKVKP